MSFFERFGGKQPEKKAERPAEVPEIQPGLQEITTPEIKRKPGMSPELWDANLDEFQRQQEEIDEKKRRRDEGGHTLH